MLVGIVAAIVFCCGRAKADFIIDEPVILDTTVNEGGTNCSASLSTDGLTLFFHSRRPGGSGESDIWMTTRAYVSDDWGPAMNLGSMVNSVDRDFDPSISADELELYFASDRSGGQGKADLWLVRRASINDAWGTPANLGSTVNSAARAWGPCISSDGLSLFFESDRSGGLGAWDVWVTTRPTTSDPWGIPMNLGWTINCSGDDFAPSITSDGLTLLFSSSRPGKYSRWDLWMTRRRTTLDTWGAPVNLGPFINTPDVEWADISPDGSTLFLSCHQRPGGVAWYNIWQAPIIPITDFNGDGIVDSADMCIMIDYWGTDCSLYDIGPMPGGDGVVDAADLEVLMRYYGQQVSYPSEMMIDMTPPRNPRPAHGCVTHAETALPLSWTPGEEATVHEIYLGTDRDAVADADVYDTTGIYRGPQDTNSYTPPEGLEEGQMYYWRIDEVKPWGTARKGDIWIFGVSDSPVELVIPIEPDTAGLAGHWEFEGNLDDSSGNGLHGTAVGDPVFITGEVGQAIEFDGVDDYVEIVGFKGITAIAGVQQPFTVANWFKTDRDGYMVGWGTKEAQKRLSFRINDGRLRAEHGGGNLQGYTTCKDGEWHHAALTVVQGAACQYPETILWLDGVEDIKIDTGSGNTYNVTEGADVCIGCRGDIKSGRFTGSIDEVRIYNQVLSQEEIAWLSGRTEPFYK